MKRMIGYERIKAHRKAIKQRLVDAFGGKCGKCGYDKCLNALEFHHLDPSQKDFNIRKSIRRWDVIVAEAKKCVCLCSNCHEEFHDGLWEMSKSMPRFDESYAEYRPVVLSRCDFCGNEKSKKNKKYCSPECATSDRASERWEDVDLKKLLLEEHLPLSRIGEMVGVTGNAVKKRAKKLGII